MEPSRDACLTILGLASDAGREEIVTARRRLAQELHPDRGGDLHRMQLVNWAADALLQPPATPPSTGSTTRFRPEPDGRDDEDFNIHPVQFVIAFTAPLLLLMIAVVIGSVLLM